MRRTNLAVAWLGVSLAGCTWVEEQRQIERRRQAETGFVEAVGSSPLATLRASLEQDRTLANGFRMIPGRRRSYPGESALTMAIFGTTPGKRPYGCLRWMTNVSGVGASVESTSVR